MASFANRNEIEESARPAVLEAFHRMEELIYGAPNLSLQLKLEIFTVASLSAGCRHCTAHGAYALSAVASTDVEIIRDLWSFETSDRFGDAERVALRFALHAGKTPSEVTPEDHEALLSHYTRAQFADILALIALSGFLNRWNDSLATVTERAPSEFAANHLGDLGWELGRHAGAEEERRGRRPGVDPLRMARS
jgi:alkylhydroperoxidase family enzyme